MLRRISFRVVLLGIASSASAQTYYRDSPGASDASKIATEMLNDAASGRFRNQNFSRPYNPFDRRIEDYENSKRAKVAELERWAAEYDRNRGQREEANLLSDGSAHLELGILVQEGKYEPGVLTFPDGMMPAT